MRLSSIFHYAAVYGLIFLVGFGLLIGTFRSLEAFFFEDLPVWIGFAGLFAVLIVPGAYVGHLFVQKERRRPQRKELIWLALSLANTALLVVFAVLIGEDVATSQDSKTWVQLFTSFQTVGAFAVFWLIAAISLALSMVGLLWWGALRRMRQLDEATADTFS